MRNTCYILQSAVQVNDLKHKKSSVTLREMDKRYSALKDLLKISASMLVTEKKLECTKQGKPWIGFSKKDLRLWLSDEDIAFVNEAEILRTNKEAERQNENTLSAIGNSLMKAYCKAIHKYKNVDIADHVRDIVELIDVIKLEALDAMANQIAKDVEEFKEKIGDLNENLTSEEQAEALKDLSDKRAESEKDEFLGEVLQMSGVVFSTQVLHKGEELV